MTSRSSSDVRSHLDAALRELKQITPDAPLDTLEAAHDARRELDRITVAAVAEALVRSGGFARRNRILMTTQIGDLLGIDRAEARLFVTAAVHLNADVTADGTTTPPRLPATADGFATGRLGLRHVQVIVT